MSPERSYGREERWVKKRTIPVCEGSKGAQGLWELYPWSTGLKVTELIRATCDVKAELGEGFWGALLTYVDKTAVNILRFSEKFWAGLRFQWIFCSLSLNRFYLPQIPVWCPVSRSTSRQVNGRPHCLLKPYVEPFFQGKEQPFDDSANSRPRTIESLSMFKIVPKQYPDIPKCAF